MLPPGLALLPLLRRAGVRRRHDSGLGSLGSAGSLCRPGLSAPAPAAWTGFQSSAAASPVGRSQTFSLGDREGRQPRGSGPGLWASAGRHPLFHGVRAVVVGLGAGPHGTESGSYCWFPKVPCPPQWVK